MPDRQIFQRQRTILHDRLELQKAASPVPHTPDRARTGLILRARLKSLCLNAMSCDSPGQEPDARHHCPCS